ncbi:NAD-dependent epimerase/dehydratase family protein [Nakamurella sp. GG22]
MAGLIILVTGVTRFIGSSLAGRLAEHPDVQRVIGVDAALPEPAARYRMGGADFARVDIRNPLVARVIDAAGVDTVVHASASSTPASSAARSMAKEMNVLGTMQLLAACQRSESVRNLIVRSTGAIYGASSRDPAIFTEEMSARSVPSSGPGRDAIDIEAYVRGFGRRRPDVRIAVPRLADVIGPTVVTPLTRYFGLSPFVPMVLGRDARLQFVHELDAVGLLEHLALGDFAGTVNVAGPGVITLAQAIHRAGRVPLAVPSLGLDPLSRTMRTLHIGAFSPGQVKLLAAGRVLDTSRLVERVGYTPRFSTLEAFDDFARTLRPAVTPDTVRGLEVRLAGALGVRAEPARAELSGSEYDTGLAFGAATIREMVEAAGPTAGAAPAGTTAPAGTAAPTGTGVAAGSSSRGAGRAPGRPRLVGIPGDGAGAPRRRRSRS